MSGEGACFLHSPPGYAPRPLDTGWYAGFGQLETGVSATIAYGNDGSRFAGATFDPSGVYRMEAVLGWLATEGVTPFRIHEHAASLQDRFLAGSPGLGDLLVGDANRAGQLPHLPVRSSQLDLCAAP